MLKSVLIIALLLVFGELFSRDCTTCVPPVIKYRFLHIPINPVDTLVFHYVPEKGTGKHYEPPRRTQEYLYLHNGNNFHAATDIFTGDIETGSGWLKNFDFGKFASVVIEINGNRKYRTDRRFNWTGKLVFIKLFNK